MTLLRFFRLLALVPYQLANLMIGTASVTWLRLAGGRRIPRSGRDVRARRVTMLSYVAVRHDPRIRRSAIALASAGYEVTIVKPVDADRGEAGDAIDWHERVRFVCAGRAGTASYFPWCFDLGMLRAVLASGADVVHCHDANTCVIGAVAAAWLRAPFVVDFHEWASEHGSTNASGTYGYAGHSSLKRWIYRRIESLSARYATALITVSESLAEAMRSALGIERGFVIIRNMPGNEQRHDLSVDYRRELDIPADQFILLHIGLLNPSRNLEQLIHALTEIPNVTFVIRGTGIDRYGPAWMELADRLGVRERVKLLPPVPSDQMIAQCRAADAGFFNIADVSLNYHCALPNKVFEYLFAGIPILAVSIPEIDRLVSELSVGELFQANDSASIVRALRRLACDRSNYEALRVSAEAARERFLASPDWDKLVQAYSAFA